MAYALNDAGQVVGTSQPIAGQEHAFLYSNGQMTDLGTLGGATSTAYSVNNLGVVVGYSYNSAGNFLGFIYQNGAMTALGTLGGSWSIAYAINDQNQIAGQAYTRGNRAAHAFRYTDGQMADLGTLGGSSSYGSAINNSGTVVGLSAIRNGSYHVFISSNGGKMQDLNKMIPARTGWVLQEGAAINDTVRITGYGTLRGQIARVFAHTDAIARRGVVHEPILVMGASAAHGAQPVRPPALIQRSETKVPGRSQR